MRKLLGFWPANVPEIPFTSFDLKRIAKSAGLKDAHILSVQSIWVDFDYWILSNFRSLLKRAGLYQFPLKRIQGLTSGELRKLIHKDTSHQLSWFSKAFTYPLLLFGSRNSL
jgi:hypothetical protein